MRTYTIPTGYLFTDKYDKGELETLSIGDYGKQANVKAQFLGLNRDIDGVPSGPCKPLSEKWVVTLSTQYGCPMKCTFCDVPKIPFKGNASFEDLKAQLASALNLFQNVNYTERLNIHFARMGEPIMNRGVFYFAAWLATLGKQWLQDEHALRTEVIHPVLTTSCPKSLTRLAANLQRWCELKNDAFNGQAGLQFSINSTNEEQRRDMFSDMALSLEDISALGRNLPPPLGRKYCLNFAYANGFEIDATKLAGLFSPEKFMVKITPIHKNRACTDNGIETVDGYCSFDPYVEAEDSLIAAGFDVIVFVPSMDEEDGLVTCGNAVLSGSEVATDAPLNIDGEH